MIRKCSRFGVEPATQTRKLLLKEAFTSGGHKLLPKINVSTGVIHRAVTIDSRATAQRPPRRRFGTGGGRRETQYPCRQKNVALLCHKRNPMPGNHYSRTILATSDSLPLKIGCPFVACPRPRTVSADRPPPSRRFIIEFSWPQSGGFPVHVARKEIATLPQEGRPSFWKKRRQGRIGWRPFQIDLKH